MQSNFSDKDLTIHVSDSAIMHLLLAGMESFCVRHWGKNVTDKRGPAETAGLLIGYKTQKDYMDHFMVEHVSTDTFAKGTSSSVALNEDVTKTKCKVIEQRWPHLSLIGDFHTHPYENYSAEAVRDKGWEASKDDRVSWKEDMLVEVPMSIALILTTAKLELQRKYLSPTTIGNNTIRWQQGKFRYWLAGYSIDRVGEESVISPDPKNDVARKHVYIDVPTINGTNAWFLYDKE